MLLLPPHSAPLSLLWYDGAMFPSLRGKLLLSLHGFRATGGRIVAYATDKDGVPAATKNARYPVYGETSRAYGAMPSAEHPLDLNEAGAEELDALPGVGPATAAAIVAHRDANGAFRSVDALGDVRGIGPAKLETLRPLVRV